MKFNHERKYGKHTFIVNNGKLFKKIISVIKKIDGESRVIPTRFGRIKNPKSSYKLRRNSTNSSELFLMLCNKKWYQRIKIECSTKIHANLLHNTLTDVLNENYQGVN